MAENTDTTAGARISCATPTMTTESASSSNGLFRGRRRRSNSFRQTLSPGRDSAGTGGSNSSSPKLGRSLQRNPSKEENGPLDDSTHSGTYSEGEKFDSLKKKSKDKKFFGVSSFMNIFSVPHHQRNHELHKIFTSLPASEKLVDDYSCALQRDILIHGRLYVTQSWLCFYANIFSWETLITIPYKSVRAITKEKTVLVIPNAIQITVSSDKYGFTSLVNRDVTYNIIFKCWQNNLLDQPLSPRELVMAARKAHGEPTDVGTEADLWGPERLEKPNNKSNSQENEMPMPTYVEIGRIPPNSSSTSLSSAVTTVNSSPKLPHQLSLPEVGMLNGSDTVEPSAFSSIPANLDLRSHKKEKMAQERSKTPPPPNFESPSSSDGRTIVPTDFLDKGSMGGESGGSAEYETVSLIEDTGEVPCGCVEHVGRTLLNDVYSTDVETIFRLLFTDSDFIRNFYKAEKTINLEAGEWQVQPDSSRLRDMSYTVALNYSFGPKFTHTTEHQIYSKTGQPGLKHIVDTEVVNHNIPYGDTFYTVCRYCITRVAHRKTRLRITANIKFKKSCWGLVKNLIERNAGDGLRTHYTHLDTILKEHVASLQDKESRAHRRASRPSTTSSRTRHKRQTPLTKLPPNSYVPVTSSLEAAEVVAGRSRDTSPMGVKAVLESRPSSTTTVLDKSDEEVPQEPSSTKADSLPRVNLALTLLLGVLIISNMLLYHHLMSYASPSETTPTPPPALKKNIHMNDEFFSERKWPESKEEWEFLMQQQFFTQSKEAGQLKNTLTSFIYTLEKIENSIGSARMELLATLHNWEVLDEDRPGFGEKPADIHKKRTENVGGDFKAWGRSQEQQSEKT